MFVFSSVVDRKLYFFIFAVILPMHYISSNSCDVKTMKDRVVIAALLGIHESGNNCTEVSVRGMQELAILEKVVSYMNINDAVKEGLKIDLKVLDTCSTTEGVTKAIVKALIMSKQICPYTPLLLGLIGPEDNKLLEAVQQITATFDKVHIIPFAPDVSNQLKQGTVFSIGISRTKQRCKVLLSMTNYLKWKSVIVIRDDYDSSVWLSDYLTDFAKDYLCVTNVLKISKYSRNAKTFFYSTITESALNDVDGIIIIMESVEYIASLSSVIRELLTNSNMKKEISFVVYLNKVGLKPWNVPNNALILQEVSSKRVENLEQFYNISLFGNYQKQLIDAYKATNCLNAKYMNLKMEQDCLALNVNIPSISFTELIDSNIVPLEYAIRILWSAVKSAHRSKCKFDSFGGVERGICARLTEISSDEWKLFLQKASFISQDSSKKISFQTSIPLHVVIYTNDVSSGLSQLGYISDNGSINIENPTNMLPIRKSATVNPCLVTRVTVDETTTTVATIIHSTSNDWFLFDLPDWLDISRYMNYEQDWLSFMLTLVAISIVFMILFFYSMRCLYSMFRVKRDNDS